jgi:hypothetical protein
MLGTRVQLQTQLCARAVFLPVESISPPAGRWVTPDPLKRASESDFDSGVRLEPVSSSASRTPNIDDHLHAAVHGNLEGMQHTLSRPDGRHVFDLDSKGTDLIVEKKQSSVHVKLFSKFLGRKSPALRS